MVLDVSRTSTTRVPGSGDWAFLLSGDSAQFVLAADTEHGGDVEPLYRAFPFNGPEPKPLDQLAASFAESESNDGGIGETDSPEVAG